MADLRSFLAERGVSLPGQGVAGQDTVDYLVQRLVAALRNAALPVREQAHHLAPFYANALRFRYRQQEQIAAVAPPPPGLLRTIPVCWTPKAQTTGFESTNSFNASGAFITAGIPEVVPPGQVVVAFPSLQVWSNDHQTVFAMSSIRWSVKVDGNREQPYSFEFPGGTESTNPDNAAGAKHPHGGLSRTERPLAPLILRSGQAMTVELFDTGAGVACDIMCDLLVEGWIFPEGQRQLAPVDMNVE